MPARYVPGISRVSRSSTSCRDSRRRKRNRRKVSVSIHRASLLFTIARMENLDRESRAQPVSSKKTSETTSENRTTASKLTWNFFESEISQSQALRSSNCDLSRRTCAAVRVNGRKQTLVSSCTRFSSCIHVCSVHVCTEGSCGPWIDERERGTGYRSIARRILSHARVSSISSN